MMSAHDRRQIVKCLGGWDANQSVGVGGVDVRLQQARVRPDMHARSLVISKYRLAIGRSA